MNGDPGRIRTCNLPLRRGLLYPVEPLSHSFVFACIVGLVNHFTCYESTNKIEIRYTKQIKAIHTVPDHNIPFLTVTAKGGWYGYRRRIPKQVRHLFENKTEWIKSLKTKNLDIAQLELRKINEWYEHRIASNGGTKKIKSQLPRERVRTVVTDLRETGLHPEDQPEINVHSNPEEISKLLTDTLEIQLLQIQFQDGKISVTELKERVAALNLEHTALYKLKKFGSERRKLKESLNYKYIDMDRMNIESIDPNIDCDAEDYAIPQLVWDESDPEVIRYRVMCGENLLPDPTW